MTDETSGADSARWNRSIARLPVEGDVIGGWRITAKLGQGGMGGVFKVTELSSGRFAALKVMLPSAAASKRLRRFEREARMLARVSHPGVVRVHASWLRVHGGNGGRHAGGRLDPRDRGGHGARRARAIDGLRVRHAREGEQQEQES